MSKDIKAGKAFIEEYKKTHGKEPKVEFFTKNAALLKQLSNIFCVKKQEWKEKYHQEFPETIDDLLRWLARSEAWRVLPPDKLSSGHWTAADIMPFIEGYLQRLADAEKKTITKPDKGEYSSKIYTPKELRKLFDIGQDTLLDRLNRQEIRNIKHSSKSYQIHKRDLPSGEN